MKQHFIPIWFFIGSLLAFYGVLVLASAIYEMFVPPAHPVAMSGLHIGIWWGGGMLMLGLLYLLRFWPKRMK